MPVQLGNDAHKDLQACYKANISPLYVEETMGAPASLIDRLCMYEHTVVTSAALVTDIHSILLALTIRHFYPASTNVATSLALLAVDYTPWKIGGWFHAARRMSRDSENGTFAIEVFWEASRNIARDRKSN
jgi:hypothetical protein